MCTVIRNTAASFITVIISQPRAECELTRKSRGRVTLGDHGSRVWKLRGCPLLIGVGLGFLPSPQRFFLKFSSRYASFLPRDALCAKRGLAIACRLSVPPPVRLVCPSVTLVDQDHIAWKSWKLIARTISPTPSLFVAQRPSAYIQGNMGKFGETRCGVGKKWRAAQKRQYL